MGLVAAAEARQGKAGQGGVTTCCHLAKQGSTGRGWAGNGRAGLDHNACSHLGHFGVKALAHLHSPMSHQDSAICVDMHQGSSLVQKLGCEGNPKLSRDDSQAPLAPPVGPVEIVTCLLPLGKSCLGDDAIPAGLQPSAQYCILRRA